MMNKQDPSLEAVKTIQKKLLGKKLNYREVYHLMDEIAHERLSDVLTTYFVAASFKEGFTADELYYLTKAMVETGTTIQFPGIVADKHSTGGVAGTRTTMILVPIIAAAGFLIPKTSSRAITSSAGTADVMEVLANVTFTPDQIKKIVEKVGGCIVWGGKLGIAPADDVIIDVEEELSFESFDKVIVSIMAKKVAVSTNHMVLDIPIGPTMKIRRREDAEKIERKFKTLGKKFDMEIVVDINEVRQPAGYGVGPVLEARDVLSVLEQRKSRSLMLEEKTIRLAGKLLDICFEDAKIKKNGKDEAKKLLENGSALRKFREILKAQGGNDQISIEKLKIRAHKHEVKASHRGTITKLNNYNLNTLAKVLGAPNDIQAGIYLERKIDDRVEKNEPVLIFYSSDKHRLNEALDTMTSFPIYEIKS
ncbi:hypothetical protein A3G67_04455 [Candidatus Roizmanbacteria bacterium RIFCSPLOWO2_12_FULL_40_12]|uniref:Pyrimidine nucleoside phosphorylase C-terminal domain-containing protein n=1 Tax=Candidatus Roizmanbacteria bacterium RIFCSPLOWO2_01_FULL_40_42 TaxID=1802066 RepID=A0A1F7J4S4_9BACT|nr:MAG: hypothetical protein A2779_04695 [Candidatus Roizmanbacteria bacterium RIFCSPHIGHO2_01_FULL_40_98]OGK27372.1 MAG: hypothetical protein A3C31_05020 [Candidatus Roizmanbacteria bacterium RIFCSPHIGHO2_02_FULL_40_53]OGK30756.1 MAG: hypothetical protein A2W49_02020 [Candidatus Roizmanbacteria bacterium RIFCSPHIGHO2_12_41_18]OGK36477.1 MAG: hypothetical protein A3E69_02645 [Candidatus Roizmanbacteria bacterium RIFCSPHIGHO2_12_FULL_40_130]OGK50605.1 MAG: hypothetical protein A3B50_02375 [Candi